MLLAPALSPPAILLATSVAGWRASPGTPGTARCGLPAIFRQRSILGWSEGGSSNGSRCPRLFRPAGCIEPRNGICAKSLSCLLVAGPLPSDLFLSAKYLRFATNEAVRSTLLASRCSRWSAVRCTRSSPCRQASSCIMIRLRWPDRSASGKRDSSAQRQTAQNRIQARNGVRGDRDAAAKARHCGLPGRLRG
jgi:hypothetical protein